MIDESKLIFFTGAPGSKWSAVSNLISLTPRIKVNITDRSEERTYSHPPKFNSAQHIGSYFGPGMEFGHKWHKLDTLSKDEILEEISKPWTEENPDEYRIVKSHVICNNLDYIAETFPKSKIMVVFRPVESCYKGWFGSGGFDIPYPKYKEHYIDEPTARKMIEEETRDSRQWIFERGLPVHCATARHWNDYWHLNDSDEESRIFRHIRSIEGYVFANQNPSRYVTLDTCLAYYNFQDIDERL